MSWPPTSQISRRLVEVQQPPPRVGHRSPQSRPSAPTTDPVISKYPWHSGGCLRRASSIDRIANMAIQLLSTSTAYPPRVSLEGKIIFPRADTSRRMRPACDLWRHQNGLWRWSRRHAKEAFNTSPILRTHSRTNYWCDNLSLKARDQPSSLVAPRAERFGLLPRGHVTYTRAWIDRRTCDVVLSWSFRTPVRSRRNYCALSGV